MPQVQSRKAASLPIQWDRRAARRPHRLLCREFFMCQINMQKLYIKHNNMRLKTNIILKLTKKINPLGFEPETF